MLAVDPPAAVAAIPVDKPPAMVIVSSEKHSDILASKDTPFPLIKARRTEDAVLRQTLFLTITLTIVRPSANAGDEVLRWTYEPYLQRQLCFTSMTGVFSCAAAELEELTDKVAGEAPIVAAPDQTAPGPNPMAEGARTAVAATLRARADALFEDDRRLNLSPILKAAGVSVRRISVSTGPVRR
jgi:hypothetical protein